jgi:hypothetical protein
MILIGLENCPGCKIIKEKHPELRYIEVPRNTEGADSQILNIKKRLAQLKIHEFPALLNDGMTKQIALSVIEPNI